MSDSLHALGPILLDFAAVVLGLIFGIGCIRTDLALTRRAAAYTAPDSWYYRIYILLGAAFIINTLGNLLPAGLLSLLAFHGSVVPLSQQYDILVNTHYSFLGFLGLISLLVFFLLFLWIAAASLILRKRGRLPESRVSESA